MDKRVKSDDKIIEEDLEIKKVANSTSSTNVFLLCILIILFCLTLFITIKYVIKYNENKKLNDNQEIIEINTQKTNALIINSGTIHEKIDSTSFGKKDEIIIENINEIEILLNNNSSEDSAIIFDVRYDILKNDFKVNNIPTNNSEVLVKFSYSFDNEIWTYVNNVISTDTSNISPLIGKTYDISGLISNLRIATNYELSNKDKDKVKMYWKSETIFKNINDNNKEKELIANFTIDYKSSL